MQDYHQVIKYWLMSTVNKSVIAAGTGTSGSASNMLFYPHGIFVSINFSLYVADCGNDRIQLFQSGQLNGTTIVGNGTIGTMTLHCPTGIVLDAGGYLFIVDSNNHRIIGSGSDGFRCLVGCLGQGSTADTLSYPATLSFDSNGNMFVTDQNNSRIQKFLLATNSCGKYHNNLLNK